MEFGKYWYKKEKKTFMLNKKFFQMGFSWKQILGQITSSFTFASKQSIICCTQNTSKEFSPSNY